MSAYILKTPPHFMKIYSACLLFPPEHFLLAVLLWWSQFYFPICPLLLPSTEDDAVLRFAYIPLLSIFRQITHFEDFAGPLAPSKFRFWLQLSFGIYELLVTSFLPNRRTLPDQMRFPWAFEPWYMAPRMSSLRCQFSICWGPNGLCHTSPPEWKINWTDDELSHAFRDCRW